MLIWIQTTAGAVGVEQGVVRANEVQTLITVEQLQRRMEESVEQALSDAHQEASQVVAAAQAQAARILEEARAEAQRLEAAAHEEGARQAAAEWHERHLQAAQDHERAMRALHPKLADVVTSAVERIVLSEDRQALYLRALRSVQSLSRGNVAMKLRVGMDDFIQARDCLGAMQGLKDAGLEVDVLADSALGPGSCIFESDLGVLDASLPTQLNALRGAMERAVRRVGTGGSAFEEEAIEGELPSEDDVRPDAHDAENGPPAADDGGSDDAWSDDADDASEPAFDEDDDDKEDDDDEDVDREQELQEHAS